MVDGKRTLCEIEGSEKDLPCDLLLIAAGFLGAENYTAQAFGVNLTQRNTVETQEACYKTNVEKIFTEV